MDTLKNKNYGSFDYTSRDASTPYYYDTLGEREVFGIGTSLRNDTTSVSHEVIEGDTLDSLALEYYNNPTYWWIIADFNHILDPFVNLYTKYKILQIPSISSIKFGRHN